MNKKSEIAFHGGNVRERDWEGGERKREIDIRNHDFSIREKRLNIK